MKFNTTFSIQLRSDITHEVSLKKALNLVNLKYLFDMNENMMLGSRTDIHVFVLLLNNYRGRGEAVY